jgi:hypothetical protein
MKYLIAIALIILAGCAGKPHGDPEPLPLNEVCELGQPIVIISGQSNAQGRTLGIATNRAVRETTGVDHCIKQLATGGSSISAWLNKWYDDYLIDLIGEPVAAIVWVQGEEDWKTPETVATYRDNLETLLSWMSQDFPQAQIIIVETCPYQDRAIADLQDPDILTCHLNRSDGIHYDEVAQTAIGNLIGKEME